jgi:hypothetical protein
MKTLLARVLRLFGSQPLVLQREPNCLCRPQCHVQFLPDPRRLKAQRAKFAPR